MMSIPNWRLVSEIPKKIVKKHIKAVKSKNVSKQTDYRRSCHGGERTFDMLLQSAAQQQGWTWL